MTRAVICILALASLIGAGCARPMSTAAPVGPKPFNVVETGIPDLRRAMAEGRITSRQLVVEYLTRIALYEDQVNAVITVNPKVLEEAEALDRERAQGKVRGPLHGIPIAIKDNIHTTDMPTTGGELAYAFEQATGRRVPPPSTP
jgi:Asp-tRNA(Asn)/Glu-tRNA(Gln) amidotransferase A subunit family amidase